MQCTFVTDSDVLIACPAGRIDTTTYNDFKIVLNAELDKTGAKHLVIDLADLEYVSSAGFREFFLAGRRMTREFGRLQFSTSGQRNIRNRPVHDRLRSS